ncbi:MAG: nucleotide exchange factor GrpE [Betaproteobacteria bacterium]|nr:MAG: nucleotide exchange factor GrpE [Betaproteobacteria bacterium]
MRRGRPQFDKMQEESVQPKEAQNGAKPIEQQLAEAQAQVEQQRDAMLRALADAENARKRFQAEAANAQKYALERFAEALLPVIDSLEAALANAEASPQALRDGVQLTLRQMTAAMEKARVTAIAPVAGERFDPYRHQAMAAVESDSEPNTVVAVMQKGYQLHDRVLRPALVTVAKPVEKAGENPISDTDLD